MAAALDLDYNSYAKCVLEDVLKPAEAWNKKESLFAMQSVVTIYSLVGAREHQEDEGGGMKPRSFAVLKGRDCAWMDRFSEAQRLPGA